MRKTTSYKLPKKEALHFVKTLTGIEVKERLLDNYRTLRVITPPTRPEEDGRRVEYDVIILAMELTTIHTLIHFLDIKLDRIKILKKKLGNNFMLIPDMCEQELKSWDKPLDVKISLKKSDKVVDEKTVKKGIHIPVKPVFGIGFYGAINVFRELINDFIDGKKEAKFRIKRLSTLAGVEALKVTNKIDKAYVMSKHVDM